LETRSGTARTIFFTVILAGLAHCDHIGASRQQRHPRVRLVTGKVVMKGGMVIRNDLAGR
jgi:hypothetical protein